MARLGLPSSIPLAVRQWNGLVRPDLLLFLYTTLHMLILAHSLQIAVNYAARAFGITRHESPIEAVKKCPALVMVHVATYRGGDTEPGYWEGDDVLPTTHKVSLDPYRRESLKIIKVFSEFCSIVGACFPFPPSSEALCRLRYITCSDSSHVTHHRESVD